MLRIISLLYIFTLEVSAQNTLPTTSYNSLYHSTYVNEVMFANNSFFRTYMPEGKNLEFDALLKNFNKSYRTYLENEEVYRKLLENASKNSPIEQLLLTDAKLGSKSAEIFNQFKALIDYINLFNLFMMEENAKTVKDINSQETRRYWTRYRESKIKAYSEMRYRNIELLKGTFVYELYRITITQEILQIDFRNTILNEHVKPEEKEEFLKTYRIEKQKVDDLLIAKAKEFLNQQTLAHRIKNIEARIKSIEHYKNLLINPNNLFFTQNSKTNVANALLENNSTQSPKHNPNFLFLQKLSIYMFLEYNLQSLQKSLSVYKDLAKTNNLNEFVRYLENVPKINFQSRAVYEKTKPIVEDGRAKYVETMSLILNTETRLSALSRLNPFTSSSAVNFGSFAIGILGVEIMHNLTGAYFLLDYQKKYFNNSMSIEESIYSPVQNLLDDPLAFTLPLIGFSLSASLASLPLIKISEYAVNLSNDFLIRTLSGLASNMAIMGITMTVGIKVSELISLTWHFRRDLFIERHKEYKEIILPALRKSFFNETTALNSLQIFISFLLVEPLLKAPTIFNNMKKELFRIIKKEQCSTSYEDYKNEYFKKMLATEQNQNLLRRGLNLTRRIFLASIIQYYFTYDLFLSKEKQENIARYHEELMEAIYNQNRKLVSDLVDMGVDIKKEDIFYYYPNQKLIKIILENDFFNSYIETCLSYRFDNKEKAKTCLEALFVDFIKSYSLNERVKASIELIDSYKNIEIYKEYEDFKNYILAESENQELLRGVNLELVINTQNDSLNEHLRYVVGLVKENNYFDFNLILSNINNILTNNFETTTNIIAINKDHTSVNVEQLSKNEKNYFLLFKFKLLLNELKSLDETKIHIIIQKLLEFLKVENLTKNSNYQDNLEFHIKDLVKNMIIRLIYKYVFNIDSQDENLNPFIRFVNYLKSNTRDDINTLELNIKNISNVIINNLNHCLNQENLDQYLDFCKFYYEIFMLLIEPNTKTKALYKDNLENLFIDEIIAYFNIYKNILSDSEKITLSSYINILDGYNNKLKTTRNYKYVIVDYFKNFLNEYVNFEEQNVLNSKLEIIERVNLSIILKNINYGINNNLINYISSLHKKDDVNYYSYFKPLINTYLEMFFKRKITVYHIEPILQEEQLAMIKIIDNHLSKKLDYSIASNIDLEISFFEDIFLKDIYDKLISDEKIKNMIYEILKYEEELRRSMYYVNIFSSSTDEIDEINEINVINIIKELNTLKTNLNYEFYANSNIIFANALLNKYYNFLISKFENNEDHINRLRTVITEYELINIGNYKSGLIKGAIN